VLALQTGSPLRRPVEPPRLQALVAEVFDAGSGRPVRRKVVNNSRTALGLMIGIELDPRLVVVNQTNGQGHRELAPTSFVEQSPAHAGAKKMKFCFRQSPL
jgi:hypothetical protein